jgi:uncharacterized protein (DUF3820 family)
MARHGRAVIPFGKKHRGVRVRLCPDEYLSWLTSQEWFMRDSMWTWLKESLLAELRFRRLRDDLADTE